MERKFFLTTERIGFSKWNKEDIKLAESLWGDPAVTKFICASGAFREEDIVNRLRQEISNDAEYGVQYWPVFDLITGNLIGCCGLRPRGKGEYEIGFHLRPAFWGKGYAVEAANAVIQYAFTRLDTKKLFAGHNPKNAASQKVLGKLGFRYTGDEFYAPTGLYHPSYELLNPIIIRAAGPEDAESIGAVHYRAWMETYTGILPDRFLASRSPERSTAIFRNTQCRNSAIAEVNGKIAGFCGWGSFRDPSIDRSMGEIQGLYLLKEYQRMHLGQKLMTYALQQLRADGFSKAGLWVLAGNTGAIRFYERMGFQDSGKRKEADLGMPVSELLYVKGSDQDKSLQ